MPKQEVAIAKLQDYLPDGCIEEVTQYLHHYRVHLTVSRQRASLLGDYRHAQGEKTHRISVNGNLNKYSFLITLLHELAHLLAFERHGNRIQPHGKEWKSIFSDILSTFVSKKIFPADIEQTLLRSIANPAASSCGDDKLLRVLHRYDIKPEGSCLVENIAEKGFFVIKGGRVFQRHEKMRTRYKCLEVKTGRWYLFSGVHEVMQA